LKRGRLAQSIIGVMLSFSITAKSLQTIAANWLPVVVLVLAMLVLASLNGIVLCRFTNLKPGTALLGTLPGGAGEMIAMSDTLGADVRLVTVMQYGRLLAILATISTAVVSQLKRLGLFVFLSNVLLLAASALLAVGLMPLLHIDFLSAYLAATPGGLDSLAAIAADLKADAALILAVHSLRLISVFILGPPLGQILGRR
jgi:uncharacterized membrane protein AbrB (regulator of aidB expression)